MGPVFLLRRPEFPSLREEQDDGDEERRPREDAPSQAGTSPRSRPPIAWIVEPTGRGLRSMVGFTEKQNPSPSAGQ